MCLWLCHTTMHELAGENAAHSRNFLSQSQKTFGALPYIWCS